MDPASESFAAPLSLGVEGPVKVGAVTVLVPDRINYSVPGSESGDRESSKKLVNVARDERA